MALLDILDPLDLGGRGAAEDQIGASQDAADILREFFDKSQENLQPFLDIGNQQLPGLEAGATPGGFFDVANTLRPQLDEIGDSVFQERLGGLTSSLGASGLTRSGFAATSAADLREDVDLSLLLQLQDMFTKRRQTVAGQSVGTGSALSRLGTQSAENVGSVLSSGILGAQQTRAAGDQNLIGLAGLGLDFLNRPPSATQG